MDSWQTVIAGVGLLVTIVIALASRDRALFQMVSTSSRELHDRITRLRDGTMSLREGEALETRMEKVLDELKAEQRRMLERLEAQNREAAARVDAGFREMKQLINSSNGLALRDN